MLRTLRPWLRRGSHEELAEPAIFDELRWYFEVRRDHAAGPQARLQCA